MGWSIWLVSFDETNRIDKTDLLFFRLLAAGPPAHHDQQQDGHSQEPEAGPAIGGIGVLDEIGQAPDQEGHAGHHGIPEGCAECDHQEEDSCPSYNFPWPRMLHGEKEIEQHRADPNQDDDAVQAAGRIQ